MAERDYYVYRYQYREMDKLEWDARLVSGGIDTLPPTVHSKPGILRISAPNKKEAIEEGKLLFESPEEYRLISGKVAKRSLYSPYRDDEGGEQPNEPEENIGQYPW